MAEKPKSGAPSVRRLSYASWSRPFLDALAATSNVAASARAAQVPTKTVYDARRTNPEFHRKWQEALCEGYDLLEMDLLLRLRTGEVKPAAGAKRGVRTYDNAVALRLLGAHKDAVSRQRAIRTNADSETILQSINAKLERIRQRAIADGEIPDDSQVSHDRK